MGVEPVDDRRLLAFDEPEALVTVEGLGEHLTGAPHQRHERALDEAEGVEERQVHEDRVVDGDAHAVAVVPRVADDAVAMEGALGEAGGARGVQDEGALLGIDRVGALGERDVTHPSASFKYLAPADGARGRAVREHDDLAEGGAARVGAGAQPRHDLAHHGKVVHRPQPLGEDHGGGVRLAEDIRHVLGAEAGIHGHEHGADLHDREHGVDPLGPVDHPERDLVAGHDAELEQALRGGIDARIEVGKGPAPPLEREGLPGAPPPSRALRQEPDRLRRGRRPYSTMSFLRPWTNATTSRCSVAGTWNFTSVAAA